MPATVKQIAQVNGLGVRSRILAAITRSRIRQNAGIWRSARVLRERGYSHDSRPYPAHRSPTANLARTPVGVVSFTICTGFD
jgi:hypothetical protein